jgi:hypothetical protein
MQNFQLLHNPTFSKRQLQTFLFGTIFLILGFLHAIFHFNDFMQK